MSGLQPDACITVAGTSVPDSSDDAITDYINQHQASVARYVEAWVNNAVESGQLAQVHQTDRLHNLALKELLTLTDMLGIHDDLREFMRVMMINAPFVDPDKTMDAELNMETQDFYIAQPDAVKARVNELKDQSREVRARLAPILKKLWDPKRDLKIVDNLKGFQNLRERFPNFAEVVNVYEANAVALSKVNQPFEAQPILLCGEPGLGKTLFAAELAKILGLPYYEIALSTVTASFALSGGSTQWEGGSVGFVAKSLADSEVGNPLFLIDELDKSSGSKYDPMNSFYGLLERHTAERFKDEAVDIELNASKIVWIATANEASNVPEAILSRVRTYEIKRPDAAGMRAVIASVYGNLRKNKPYGRLLQDSLNEDVIEALIDQLPRAVRQSLEDGMLKAIMADRDFVIQDDLITGKRKGKPNVGFI